MQDSLSLCLLSWTLPHSQCLRLAKETWDHPKHGQYGGKDKAERQSEAILIIPVRNDSAIKLLIAVEVVRNVCFGLCFQSRSSAISKHSEREREWCVCVCVCVCVKYKVTPLFLSFCLSN